MAQWLNGSYDGSKMLTNGNVIVVVDGNQIAELQMSGQARRLAGNTFHGTTISKEAVRMVGDQVKAGLVELGRGVGLTDGQTDRVRETLSQWTGRHFDTGRVVRLGMARSDAVDGLILKLKMELSNWGVIYLHETS